jgi:hypothetical protein
LAFDPVYRTGPALANCDLAAFDTSIARTMSGFTVEQRGSLPPRRRHATGAIANKLIDPTSFSGSLTNRLRSRKQKRWELWFFST